MDITVTEFVGLREYVREQLVKSGQNIRKEELAVAMLQFGDKFSLGAMLRFKDWMLENGYHDDEVLAGIVHDLNDRNDSGFLPRTAGY